MDQRREVLHQLALAFEVTEMCIIDTGTEGSFHRDGA